MRLDFSFEVIPIVQICGLDVPHVVLKNSLGHRRALISLVGAQLLGNFAAGLHGPVVNGLEDLLVKELGLGALEWVAHQDEGVG